MAWNFREDELRTQLADLNKKLSVQGVQLGEHQTRLLKSEDELRSTKQSLEEVMQKLRSETDRALYLEEALKKRTEELQKEKVTRENIENALRSADEQKKDQASSVREAQSLIDRLASETESSRQQYEKLLADKAKLESMVRELQGELRQHEIAPPKPPKTPVRPRSSSLNNIHKVAMLERDMEEIRLVASSSRVELDATKEKLSRVQGELVRVENEKAVVEKKLRDSDQKLRDALEDRDDIQRELDFYRTQNDSAERERELLERLEEEENKVNLLEKQLEQASRSTGSHRALEKLRSQLNNEISRREAAETRGIELVQEKEEALNALDELQENLQEVRSELALKESRIRHLQQTEGQLHSELNDAENKLNSSPSQVDEAKVFEMLDAIERLRDERNQLKADLEFVQMESHFKVEALEKKLQVPHASSPNDSNTTQSESVSSSRIHVDRAAAIKKLQTMSTSLCLVVSRFHSECEDLRNRALLSAETHNSVVSQKNDELASMRRILDKYIDENTSLQEKVVEVEDHLQKALQNLESREDELTQTKLNLRDVDTDLRAETEHRASIENQLQGLEIEYSNVKQQLEEAVEECKRLETNFTPNGPPSDESTSLRKKIEVLEARVQRRTQQIGQHQHDIKRLETNMALLEERLEEVTGELELAETAKRAMVEDCEVTREQREVAQKALVQSGLQIEQLSANLDETVRQLDSLKEHLQELESQVVETDSLRGELVSVSNVAMEQEERIGALLNDLGLNNLDEVKKRIEELDSELDDLQTSSGHTIQKLRDQLASDNGNHVMELERYQLEIQGLREELSTCKTEYEGAVNALQAKSREYERTASELQRLSSELTSLKSNKEYSESLEGRMDQEIQERCRLEADLEHARLALAEMKDTIQTKEDQLTQKTKEVESVVNELQSLTASNLDLANKVQIMDSELNSKKVELDRLVSDIESLRGLCHDSNVALSEKTEQNTKLQERITLLEKEKTEISARLSAFEVESEKDLNEAASLRGKLEEERVNYESNLKRLEADIQRLEHDRATQANSSQATTDELQARYDETCKLLEVTKKELEDQLANYEAIIEGERKATSSHEAETQALREQVSTLTAEISDLRCSLQDETEKLKREIDSYQQEIQKTMNAGTSTQVIENELRQEIEGYQQQVIELRQRLIALQGENTALQSDFDNLTGEAQRAKSMCHSLEISLATKGREVSELHSELTRLKELHSQSERIANSSEMKLLLNNQEHDRAITNLRNQLKEHEKDAERIKSLQQTVSDMKEKIEEMDTCLQSKCSEIEENDDKFIQMLKEKKKLTSKIDSLTKKNNSLQNKLKATSEALTRPEPVNPQSIAPPESSRTDPVRESPKPQLPSQAPEQSFPMASERRTSGTKRPRSISPEDRPGTSIGKKRPLPDDADFGRATVEARFPDLCRAEPNVSSTPPSLPSSSSSSSYAMPSIPSLSELSSTPRGKRPLQTLRTGFTPMRGQTILRPTLSQPSPIRKSASRTLQPPTGIMDVTNSPPKAKRVFTVEPGSNEPRTQRPAGKGWLGKIRGGANRPRQHPT